MSHLQLRWLALAALGAAFCSNMCAVDGVILIDQNRALSGGVTPADTPGFPVTISVPGSYRLSGNLTVQDANTTAILIATNNVSIDLNGFNIVGPTVCTRRPLTCSTRGTGVGVDGRFNQNITVVNGTVRGMGAAGVFLDEGSVEKVHADSNGEAGFEISFGSVSECTADSNRLFGILSNNGVVRGNRVRNNGDTGIQSVGSTVSGNTAISNGLNGIRISCPSSVVGNTAYDNGGMNLVTTGSTCVLANNAAP